MLGKLFKYDLKANARILLPLYAALVVVAALMAALSKASNNMHGQLYINPAASNVVGTIIAILYILLICAVILITIVLVLQNYYRNLLGDQGYLMFTLPVKIQTHVTEKALSGGFWIFVSSLVAAFSVFVIGIIYAGPVVAFSQIGHFFDQAIKSMGLGHVSSWGILIVVLTALASLEFTLKVYAAISMGHLAKKHRGGISVLAYIAFSVIESIVANVLNLAGLDQALVNLSEVQNGLMLMLVITLIVLLLSVIYWVISTQVLKRNLNLQ